MTDLVHRVHSAERPRAVAYVCTGVAVLIVVDLCLKLARSDWVGAVTGLLFAAWWSWSLWQGAQLARYLFLLALSFAVLLLPFHIVSMAKGLARFTTLGLGPESPTANGLIGILWSVLGAWLWWVFMGDEVRRFFGHHRPGLRTRLLRAIRRG